jgi:curved DNA-binding protein
MRAYYQRYGHWPSAGGPTAGTRGSTGGNYRYRTLNEEDLEDLFGGQSPFSDFFETYFGSSFFDDNLTGGRTRTTSRRQQRPTTGEDVESPIEVSLPEAYQGVTRTFELMESDGRSRRLEVKIPAGVHEGARIRVAGQGMQGAAGRGDLYLRVHIAPDPRFTREGSTLRTHVDVPLATAVLGGEVQVSTPDGRRLMLRIPTGTDNGRSFRLSGQGMPHVGRAGERGDLYAEVRVVLPKHLNSEQRRLFEAFAHSIGYSDNQKS